jgi:phosphoribosylanthranilate isomerase
MTVRVKVCGCTRVEDAVLAAELGASAIGLVFWPGSPRCVDVATAQAIVAALPPLVTPVGVFADQTPADVRRVLTAVGLGAVQLHGGERLEDFADLPARLIKAVPVVDGLGPESVAGIPPAVAVLLDAHDPVRRGGTGQLVDWDVAARIAAVRPIVLSGGLRPENVAAAVRRVRPAAVDVASGVERAPGVKDPEKLRAFFAALEAAARA